MNQLAQKNILVLGLGASGLAMARWCAREGAKVVVADTRDVPPQLPVLQAQVPSATFVHGALTKRCCCKARLIWCSRARVWRLHPSLH